MNLELEVKNFRGIKDLTVPINKPITLIGGFNGSGKTTLAMAIQVAVEETAAPLNTMKAKDAKALLNEESQRGKVTLTCVDTGSGVRVNFPGGTVNGGSPIKASRFALGLESISLMKPKEASDQLMSYMNAQPTINDLAEAVGDKIANSVWPVIEAEGWDKAAAQAKETGIKLKGQWEGLTSENYGSAKAINWMPSGAQNNIAEDGAEEKLKSELDKAKADQRELLSRQAPAQEDIDNLQRQVDRLAELDGYIKSTGSSDDIGTINNAIAELRSQYAEMSKTKAKAEAVSDHAKEQAESIPGIVSSIETDVESLKVLCEEENELRKKFDELCQTLQSLPRPESKQITAPCPSCGTHLVVINNQMSMPEIGIEDSENDARQKAINSTKGQVAEVDSQINEIVAKKNNLSIRINELKSKLANAEDAKKKLLEAENIETIKDEDLDQIKKLAESYQQIIAAINEREHIKGSEEQLARLKAMTGATPDQIQVADEMVSEIEIDLSLCQLYKSTQKIAKAIAGNKIIADALAPDGVRKQVVVRAIDAFNSDLNLISTKANWPVAKVENDLSVTFGGRIYWLLSESEKFRCRVTLQLAMARIDKSELVVIDAADILDKYGKNGLFSALMAVGIPSFVTMTFSDKDKMPDLSASGIGFSKWIS